MFHRTTSDRPSDQPQHRRRYAVAAVLVAASSGALIAGVNASAFSEDESTFVPIVPCRLFDTRPEYNVGPRSTRLQENETYTQQVTGTNGNCVIPQGITGIALNVTVVQPTAFSYLTVWPAGGPTPVVSNLNYQPGSPATPNKVDVKVSADGKVNVLNRFGSTHVLADVAGYYTKAGLTDITNQLNTTIERVTVLEGQMADQATTNAEMGARVDALETDVAALNVEVDLLGGSQPFVVTDVVDGVTLTLGTPNATVATVSVTAPSDGQVTLASTVNVDPGLGLGLTVQCSITDGTVLDTDYLQVLNLLGIGQLSGTRTFDVVAGESYDYGLVCAGINLGVGLNVNLSDIVLTGIYTPAA